MSLRTREEAVPYWLLLHLGLYHHPMAMYAQQLRNWPKALP